MKPLFLVLVPALSAALASACHSTRMTSDATAADAGGAAGAATAASAGGFTSLTVGSQLERKCSSAPEGIQLPITNVACAILTDVDRVRANLTTSADAPVLAVTFDGLKPGRASTADPGTTTDVILQGRCPARARSSAEPCQVELFELVRGDNPAPSGQIEKNSSIALRVSCPPSMQNDQGDAASASEQSPRNFEIVASDCVVY